MSLKVFKSSETQDYQKDGSGWLLCGIPLSAYNILPPIYGAYSTNLSITSVNLIKLGINKEVIETTSLATSLFNWLNGQYLTNESEVLSMGQCIYKVEFMNGFERWETEPFRVFDAPEVVSNWILADGTWNDSGIWIDAALWID